VRTWGSCWSPHKPPDPVFKTSRGWFFYDETWTRCYGPFDDEPSARGARAKYILALCGSG